jgi:hypothetical protein
MGCVIGVRTYHARPDARRVLELGNQEELRPYAPCTMFRPVFAALLSTLCVGPACSRKGDDGSVGPKASALTASAGNPVAPAWHYQIDAKSETQVDMPGVKEHIKGSTSGAAGTLDIVPGDLGQSRGLVRIDLSTFTTHTFGDESKDATQTKHARTWLESVVDGKTNEPMRWAEFAIRSVDGLSATDVRKVASVKDGSDEVRTVTMTVHGDLLIHGHKIAKQDPVDLVFRYPAGASPESMPTRIEVKSKEPMRVTLKDHEVSPRDPAGQLLAWTAALVSKVAETADVTVALSAAPSP